MSVMKKKNNQPSSFEFLKMGQQSPFFDNFRQSPVEQQLRSNGSWRKLILKSFVDDCPIKHFMGLRFESQLEREIALQCVALKSGRLDLLEYCMNLNGSSKHNRTQSAVFTWPKDNGSLDIILNCLENPKVYKGLDIESLFAKKLKALTKTTAAQNSQVREDSDPVVRRLLPYLKPALTRGFDIEHSPGLGSELHVGLEKDSIHADLNYYRLNYPQNLPLNLKLAIARKDSPYFVFLSLASEPEFVDYLLRKIPELHAASQSSQLRHRSPHFHNSTSFQRVDERRISINKQDLEQLHKRLTIETVLSVVTQDGNLIGMIESLTGSSLIKMKPHEIRAFSNENKLVAELIKEASKALYISDHDAFEVI